MIIVDASVAVKWFVREPGAKAARALLGGSERLIAPALIRMEVAAAMTRKARTGELSPEDSQASCDIWLRAIGNGVLALSRDEDDLAAAIKLAIEIKHPLRDCLYLALARRRVVGSLRGYEEPHSKPAPVCHPNMSVNIFNEASYRALA